VTETTSGTGTASGTPDWPTAELHVHLEGTMEVELVVELARRNGVALPSYDPDVLRESYAFADLQAFLDRLYANLRVLRTEQDFHDLASAYLRRAHRANVRRAEMFFDPQTHLGNGIPFEAVIGGFASALDEARRELGMSVALIPCLLRERGADAAMDMLDVIMPFREHFVAMGMVSTEVGYPPSLFAEVYARAASEGLHLVAHAGEEGPPDYVRDAVDVLHVERVDHGNRTMEDPDLVRRLADLAMPLTVCPLSNVALGTAPRELSRHPLPEMMAAGLAVTVNSDDPAYFGGYIDDNYRAIAAALPLDAAALATLARNSFAASFAEPNEKATWIAEVDAALTDALR
jgi:adenosine deaminase